MTSNRVFEPDDWVKIAPTSPGCSLEREKTYMVVFFVPPILSRPEEHGTVFVAGERSGISAEHLIPAMREVPASTSNEQAIDTELVNNVIAAAEVAEMAGFTGEQVWKHVKGIVMEIAGISETEAMAVIQEAQRRMAAEDPSSEPKTFTFTTGYGQGLKGKEGR